VVAVEQFLEGVPITRDVRSEQLGIAALVLGYSPGAPHSRTLSTPGHPILHQFSQTRLTWRSRWGSLGMTG